jgi:kinesin family protein 5
MAQNVRVCCRFRPFNARELRESGGEAVINTEDQSLNNTLVQLKKSALDKADTDTGKFSYDRVFWPNISQADVYTHAAKPLVQSIMDGFNTTIFAYGQTGSG